MAHWDMHITNAAGRWLRACACVCMGKRTAAHTTGAFHFAVTWRMPVCCIHVEWGVHAGNAYLNGRCAQGLEDQFYKAKQLLPEAFEVRA